MQVNIKHKLVRAFAPALAARQPTAAACNSSSTQHERNHVSNKVLQTSPLHKPQCTGSTSTAGSSLQQQHAIQKTQVRNKHRVVTTFAPALAARRVTAASCHSSSTHIKDASKKHTYKLVTTFAPALAARQPTAAACSSGTHNKRHNKSATSTRWRQIHCKRWQGVDRQQKPTSAAASKTKTH
jgi:hypothetical protein